MNSRQLIPTAVSLNEPLPGWVMVYHAEQNLKLITRTRTRTCFEVHQGAQPVHIAWTRHLLDNREFIVGGGTQPNSSPRSTFTFTFRFGFGQQDGTLGIGPQPYLKEPGLIAASLLV